MAKYAKVDRNSSMVKSVENYDRAPQVADHERTSIEYVEINEDKAESVQIGHPLPAEARKQPGQPGQPGHGGDPGHQGQGGGQAGAPGQQPDAQPKSRPPLPSAER